MKFLIGLLFKFILKRYSLFFTKRDTSGDYEAYYINGICIDDGMNEIIFEHHDRKEELEK